MFPLGPRLALAPLSCITHADEGCDFLDRGGMTRLGLHHHGGPVHTKRLVPARRQIIADSVVPLIVEVSCVAGASSITPEDDILWGSAMDKMGRCGDGRDAIELCLRDPPAEVALDNDANLVGQEYASK